MNQINGPAVLIDDGGVASLTVCCLANEPSRLTPITFSSGGPGSKSRTDAVKRRADLLGLASPIIRPARATEQPSTPNDPPSETTALLLDAGREALHLGINRVIWPIHLGIDLDTMERELDRARLVERLLNLDAPASAGSEAIRIETPFLDLSDEQIATLAADLDAPLDAAWWCQKDGPAPCGRCGSCRRWEAVLASPQRA